MTSEELKKIDRFIREIPYPFGKNYLLFKKIMKETANGRQIAVSDVIRQYVDWKDSKGS
ncbi:MAG: hypothetical protein LKJ21_02695 [Oscillospiraceae bacterium]|jgi:hypothetical protein|nr:hypothetical protein [Oscillospiraceae bacterium]MCI1990611.1 hypothetical protein [Oscillospiraceae bacterium]MCI2035514.1 hypothetical protein [Oscillospiraceae bacterium]